MTDLYTIVPSHGRPATVADLAAVFHETCTAETTLIIAVDENDPELFLYAEHVAMAAVTGVRLWVNRGRKTMVGALNGAALDRVSKSDVPIAFMGDDHRPRTVGWDRAYLDALAELGTGIVYGDDLLQHERIPTQAAMTADIIRTLGHMAPPQLTHLFVDNYWFDLGKGADCIRYLPDVVIEHVHPFAQKAAMDEGYRRVNAPAKYSSDQYAYGTYVQNHHLAADIAKVKALR